MIRLSSAFCLPLYVGRYSASSFRSASRPSRLGVSMIKRNGLFLMQPTITAYSIGYAFFPPSPGGRSLSKYGVVLLVSNVSEAWVNSCEVRDELESPLVVTPLLCSIEARRFSLVSRNQSHRGPRSDTSANRITAPLPYRDEAPTS